MRYRAAIAMAIVLVMVLTVPAFAGGEDPQGKDKPEAGIWGLYPNVIAEYIKIPGFDEPNTPDEFDHAYFMRYRYNENIQGDDDDEEQGDDDRDGGVKAIILAMPGGGCGQGLWLQLASQIVDAGKGDIEVWVIDRRENGLEDTEGMKRAIAAQDAGFPIAWDYYFGLGGPPEFTLITQEDASFMAYWSLEVIIRDAEAVLNLIPEEYQSTNVFMAGHSQGGSFMFDFAGYEFPDGKAGYEKLAGLIFVDGGPRISDDNEGTYDQWVAAVDRLITGVDPVYGVQIAPGIYSSPYTAIPQNIASVMGFFDPNGESPLLPLQTMPWGGEPANDFLQNLRLTNEAYANWFFDDDPIPGSMTQMYYMYTTGARSGRLDFPTLTEPAPFFDPDPEALPEYYEGLSDLIDPNEVYGWFSGGGGEVAGETDDGPLSGWPLNYLLGDDWQLYPPNPNPTRADTMCLVGMWAGEATNIKEPTTYVFSESGEIEIYEASPNQALWYQNARYDLDVTRAGDLWAPELGITRKADVDIPTIAYSRLPRAANVEEYLDKTEVTDCTLIDSTGVQYWGEAEDITTFPEEINTRLYNHVDFVTADNSLAGEVPPGAVGAHVITNTIVPWILDRVDGTVPVPTPQDLGIDLDDCPHALPPRFEDED